MPIQVRLVHAEAGSRVVEASFAREGGPVLATALGEGPSAEAAEDRARQRLQVHLEGQTAGADSRDSRATAAAGRQPEAAAAETRLPGGWQAPGPASATRRDHQPEPDAAPAAQPQPVAAQAEPAAEPPGDPEDWSGELARIDLELQRLGWQRQEESTYLERAFGHPSRSRITTYADLLAYLQALEGLGGGSNPASAPVPLRRRDLLSQCDGLLAQLGWDANRGRQLLEERFGRASRQQLSDSQLLQFNMALEEAVLLAGAGGPGPEGG